MIPAQRNRLGLVVDVVGVVLDLVDGRLDPGRLEHLGQDGLIEVGYADRSAQPQERMERKLSVSMRSLEDLLPSPVKRKSLEEERRDRPSQTSVDEVLELRPNVGDVLCDLGEVNEVQVYVAHSQLPVSSQSDLKSASTNGGRGS